jgi:hypothetical protein
VHRLAGFYDSLKSRSSGYASLDYEEGPLEDADVVQLSVRVNNDPIDAMTSMVNPKNKNKKIQFHLYVVPRAVVRALRQTTPPRLDWAPSALAVRQQPLILKSQNFTELYQTLPNFTKLYQTLPNFTELYQTLPNFTKLYRTLPYLIKLYGTLQDFTGLYGTLRNFTELYGTLRNFTELCGTLRNIEELYGPLRNFTELYRTLRNFTEGTLRNFTELYGTLRNLTELYGTLRNFAKLYGTFSRPCSRVYGVSQMQSSKTTAHCLYVMSWGPFCSFVATRGSISGDGSSVPPIPVVGEPNTLL